MLVTTDVGGSLIGNSGRWKANCKYWMRWRSTERSRRCLQHNRKVKGIISCFILPEPKSSPSTPTHHPARSLCHADRLAALLHIFHHHRLWIFSLLFFAKCFYIHFPTGLHNQKFTSFVSSFCSSSLCSATQVNLYLQAWIYLLWWGQSRLTKRNNVWRQIRCPKYLEMHLRWLSGIWVWVSLSAH